MKYKHFLSVDREADAIRNVELMRVGTATGGDHSLQPQTFEITHDTLAQVYRKLHLHSDGIPCRFFHSRPEENADPFIVGAITDIKLDADRIIGDLHLSEWCKLTISSGLTIRETLFYAAEVDPMACGLSAVFSYFDAKGAEGGTAMRVDEVIAVDLVDKGAATPDGLGILPPPKSKAALSIASGKQGQHGQRVAILYTSLIGPH